MCDILRKALFTWSFHDLPPLFYGEANIQLVFDFVYELVKKVVVQWILLGFNFLCVIVLFLRSLIMGPYSVVELTLFATSFDQVEFSWN